MNRRTFCVFILTMDSVQVEPLQWDPRTLAQTFQSFVEMQGSITFMSVFVNGYLDSAIAH